MKKSPRRTAQRKNNSTATRRLDRLAGEAIDLCAWVIARCGYSPVEAAQRFTASCAKIPHSVTAQGRGTSQKTELAGHVLTLWYQESDYLLPDGEPRVLPARGPAPSIEDLVRRVGNGLTLDLAMRFLLQTGSLRETGTGFVPRDRAVLHPGNSTSQQAFHMRVFIDFLRTLDHNTRARTRERRWMQSAADNLQFPVSKLARLDTYLRKSARAFLADKDSVMHGLALTRRRGEPTVPVSIGTYMSHGAPEPDRRNGTPRPTRRPGAQKGLRKP
ncbi:MAG TPA: hypothetical protein VJQ47_17785 [Steroidobacteraceae bacterium]|nr:hypothetical protein [Steroidobacteraceae bacterium]